MIEGKFTDKTHLIGVTVISVLFVSITGGISGHQVHL